MGKMFLVRKELLQHRLFLLAMMAFAVLLPVAVVLIDKYDGLARTVEQRAALDLSIALVISYFAPSNLGYSLMAAERTKRTLLILRMLPLKTSSIIFGKELAGGLALLILTAANLLAFLAAFRVWIAPFPFHLSLLPLIAILLTLFLLLQVSLWLFLSFEQKWASQAPFLLACAIRPVILIYQRYAAALPSTVVTAIPYLAIILALLLSVVLHRWMVSEFDRQDWAMPTTE